MKAISTVNIAPEQKILKWDLAIGEYTCPVGSVRNHQITLPASYHKNLSRSRGDGSEDWGRYRLYSSIYTMGKMVLLQSTNIARILFGYNGMCF